MEIRAKWSYVYHLGIGELQAEVVVINQAGYKCDSLMLTHSFDQGITQTVKKSGTAVNAKTGDTGNQVLWLVLALIAVVLAGGVYTHKKGRKQSEE